MWKNPAFLCQIEVTPGLPGCKSNFQNIVFAMGVNIVVTVANLLATSHGLEASLRDRFQANLTNIDPEDIKK